MMRFRRRLRQRPVQRAVAAAAGVVVTLTVAGCSSTGTIATDAPPTATTPPRAVVASSPPAPYASAQALSAYEHFWAAVPVAAAAPAERRRAILAPYATDPELPSLLSGMQGQDRHGEMIYGRNLPRARITSLSVKQRIAVFWDCQDSSHSGVESKATHEPLTVGTPRNLVVTTMQLGVDGRWRVAYVTYPRSPC